MTRQLSRRDFCAFASLSIAFGSACCRNDASQPGSNGRLNARPREGIKTVGNGRIMVDLDSGRETILQLPSSAGVSPLPLLVMLHGATQSAEDMFWYLGSTHEEAGVVVLAPKSRGRSWDAIGGSFGSDVEFLNRAMEKVFATVAIDPKRIAIGGFSDGASYAISLGLINGDLFNRVVAFSPGFVIDGDPHGEPHFFVSHGLNDRILPIDRCGRHIVAGLSRRGYEVTFREFDGDHEIPEDIAREGMNFIRGT